MIAADGPSAVYEGDIAGDIVDAVQEAARQPGLLTLTDLAAYRAVERSPVHGEYRGYDIYGMGPPSSGGITMIETLNILEGFDLPSMSPHSADALHLILEAEKLAFADRNRYIGDADHVVVPTETLLSDTFADARRRGIKPGEARQGPVRAAEIDTESRETTHFSIADAEGNVIAVTTTIEAPFGSAMVVPGRGFLLNNELTDFDAYPRDGRGRAAANRVEPGKRPRSSMSPTIVMRGGKPVLAVGSPGGSRIIGITTHVVLNVLDWKMDVQDAVNAPRVLDRGRATSELEALFFDDDMLDAVIGVRGVVDALRKRGHAPAAPTKGARAVGGVHAVTFLPDGTLAGAADPRREGLALGVD
jgi:gamma-glutamyltranspeptidase/glutathione hydrolase